MRYWALLRQFVRDESGTAAIEYSIIAALVSVVALRAFFSLGSSLEDILGLTDSTLTDAVIS